MFLGLTPDQGHLFMSSYGFAVRAQLRQPALSSFASVSSRREPITRLRIRLSVDNCNRQESITTPLISTYGLIVKVTNRMLAAEGTSQQFDLELVGTTAQLQAGLAYLNSLDSRIQGKANADGDGWHC